MSAKIYKDGAWEDVENVKQYVDGAWTDKDSIKAYDADSAAWVEKWSAKYPNVWKLSSKSPSGTKYATISSGDERAYLWAEYHSSGMPYNTGTTGSAYFRLDAPNGDFNAEPFDIEFGVRIEGTYINSSELASAYSSISFGLRTGETSGNKTICRLAPKAPNEVLVASKLRYTITPSGSAVYPYMLCSLNGGSNNHSYWNDKGYQVTLFIHDVKINGKAVEWEHIDA